MQLIVVNPRASTLASCNTLENSLAIQLCVSALRRTRAVLGDTVSQQVTNRSRTARQFSERAYIALPQHIHSRASTALN